MGKKMLRMINTWQKLARIEWYRSFWNSKPNKDFLWLTVLLSLTLILALLLWSGREGLLNKFVDVSVGHIEGAGIPIWLAANNVNGINKNILQNTELQNIKIYPYREVEWHEVNLPDPIDDAKIWNANSFEGWAVASDDPLWKIQSNTASQDLSLNIILNKSLFQQHFNCDAYIKALQIPYLTIPDNDCLSNNILWLNVKLGSNKELLPFNIHWQSHIPTMQDLAFLFPLSTLNILKIIKKNPELKYYPEASNRITQLMLWDNQNKVSADNMSKLLSCLQNPNRKNSQISIKNGKISIKQPLPKKWVAACAEQNNIQLQLSEERLSQPYIQILDDSSESHNFQYDDTNNHLTISCQNNYCNLCETIQSLKKLGNAINCSEQEATINMTLVTGSYQKAFAYVKDRTKLATQVENIKNFQLPQQDEKTFYIHPTYDDALVRFQFIDKIMVILERSFGPFFLIFLAILLYVQIGIIITHRKHDYGILFSKGTSYEQIQGIMFIQIFISFVVAMAITILVGEVMQYWFAISLENIVSKKPYIDHIVASNLDLLPASFLDYILIGCIALSMLYLITVFILKQSILKWYKEPAYLF